MNTKRVSRYLPSLGIALCASVSICSTASAQCSFTLDGLRVNYNIVDERDAGLLMNINGNHFNADVEGLIRGQSTANLDDELDYVLINVPNHHRALYAMAQLHLRENKEKLPAETYSMPCWFERAIAFTPQDPAVRMIYGIYLHKKKNYRDAEQRYHEALELEPNLVEAHYNIALLYIDLNRYDEAVTHAKRAYELGYPLPGLRQKLVRMGRWDPVASASPGG